MFLGLGAIDVFSDDLHITTTFSVQRGGGVRGTKVHALQVSMLAIYGFLALSHGWTKSLQVVTAKEPFQSCLAFLNNTKSGMIRVPLSASCLCQPQLASKSRKENISQE